MFARIAFTAIIVALTAACLWATLPEAAKAAPMPAPVPCTVIPWAGQHYAICGATTCATVNNTTNRLAWTDSRGVTTSLPYRDRDYINVTRRVPASVRAAIRKLTTGGPAIARVCR